MNDIIITENLIKYYGKIHAVDSISLNVKKGEIYGFLGLNGAGKTTTIRMLLGIISPTSGKSYLNGKKVHAGNNDLWNNVGYLVEIPYSYPDLTVYENLEIVRRLRLIADSSPVESVMEKLKLSPYRDRKAKDLSHGNAQRLGIAKAIIHNPDILILDEPATGIDAVGEADMYRLLEDYQKERGATFIMITHDWHAATHHADFVLLLNQQQISFGSPEAALSEDNLRKAFGHIGHDHALKFLVKPND